MSLGQKKCIKYSLIGSLIFISFAFHIDTLVARFLLVGELPGNTSLLPPDAMMAVLSILAIFVVAFFVRSMISTAQKKHRQGHLPSRRYQSIQ